jgi:hypothetical protein
VTDCQAVFVVIICLLMGGCLGYFLGADLHKTDPEDHTHG